MTVAELMGQSAILTVLGMGVVFAFLTIMVISVELTARVIRALGVDREPATIRSAGGASDAKRQAAVAAALHEHRKRQDS